MASKALRFCSHHGCPELTSGRFCPAHAEEYERSRTTQRAQYQKTRSSAASQGYDTDWTKARLMYLSRHPLCEICQKDGRITPAVMVHHIRALKDNGARLDPDNMCACCNTCHEKIEGPNRWKRRKDETERDAAD